MKHVLLFSAAIMAMAAQAQSPYQVDPSTDVVVKAGVSNVKYVTLSEEAIADFKKAGATVDYVGPDAEAGRNLWYWENTFSAGDESYPRVDMAEGGYISVEVSGVADWSGAGLAVDTPIDLSSFNDDTHFHLAYMTSATAPASVAVIILDKADAGSMPAKFSLGETAFIADGAPCPIVGDKISDDWQGIDITFAQLKKIFPTFAPANLNAWTGNLFSFLGGAVKGTTFAFDAVYFYNTPSAGIADAAAEAEFVVTANTVNVAGANGIELYNINGQLVKSTEGTTLGLTGLSQGVYVARSGNAVKKIIVR